jgi:UDPglucose 6-dehydrogenase
VEFHGLPVIHDFNKFTSEVDVIIVNRMGDELQVVADKGYTRELFGKD